MCLCGGLSVVVCVTAAALFSAASWSLKDTKLQSVLLARGCTAVLLSPRSQTQWSSIRTASQQDDGDISTRLRLSVVSCLHSKHIHNFLDLQSSFVFFSLFSTSSFHWGEELNTLSAQQTSAVKYILNIWNGFTHNVIFIFWWTSKCDALHVVSLCGSFFKLLHQRSDMN